MPSKDSVKQGESVLAKWPGSSLYYDAVIVRFNDEKVTVRFSEGTEESLLYKHILGKKAKVATERRSKSPSRTSRSTSRSRSSASRKSPTRSSRSRQKSKSPAPSRKPSRSSSRGRPPAKTEKKERSETPEVKKKTTKESKPKIPDETPKNHTNKLTQRKLTPTRSSTRIAALKKPEEAQKTEVEKTQKTNEIAKISNKTKMGFFSHLGIHLLVLTLPALLLFLRFSCTKKHCTITEMPRFPKSLKSYITPKVFGLYCAWNLIIFVLCLIPFGKIQSSSISGKRVRYRINGFLVMILSLILVAALNYFEVVHPKFFVINYNQLMVSSILFAALISLVLQIKSYWVDKSELNPQGNTGCPVTDFFIGREGYPRFGEFYDVKMVCLRAGCITWMVLLIEIALYSYMSTKSVYSMNPSLVLITIFQGLYVGLTVYYEEMLTTMASFKETLGFATCFMGFSFLPFFSSLQSLYMYYYNPVLPTWVLVFLTFMYVAGMVILFRSNLQKHIFKTNPYDPRISHLETITTSKGNKLLVTGWWGFICHPNYFGELMINMTFSYVAGFTHVFPYFILGFTLYNLFSRALADDHECGKKYGTAWEKYRQRVKHRLIPCVW